MRSASQLARGFESGTSLLIQTRTGWDGLASLAVSRVYPFGALRADHHLGPLDSNTRMRSASQLARGFESGTSLLIQTRTGWDSNPRGREPTRFPIVRLKPLGHPSSTLGRIARQTRIRHPSGLRFSGGSGMDSLRSRVAGMPALARFARITTPARSTRPRAPRPASQLARVGSNPEPVRRFFSGGSGIRTHADLSVQRLSRAPP